MATVELNSIIEIGAYKPFRGVHEITIKKSIRNYCNTAMVKLPATAVLKQSGTAETHSVDTAKQFKRGDKINIRLGYNGLMREEFEGFISRVNKTTPCELECEGYAFLLHNKQVNKVWKNTTLKAVLTEIISGTEIVLDKGIDDIKLDYIPLVKVSAFKALESLGKQCAGTIAFWMDKNVLYAGLAYEQLSEKNKKNLPDVKYKIGYNVVRDGQMKEHIAGDNKYEVELVFKQKDGKKHIATVGTPNSNSIRKRTQAVSDNDLRKRMASELEQSKNYTGFEGKIVTFLQPYCKPSQKASIEDPRYPERSGDYLIEHTELKYGHGGAKRTVGISIKL